MREIDENERRDAIDERRARRRGRTVYRTYDDWKLAGPNDDAVDAPEDDESPPPYGEWCRNPGACKGKGYCPLDPTCGD